LNLKPHGLPDGSGGDSAMPPINGARRTARCCRSCSVKKLPISQLRPPDSIVSRVGRSGETSRRSLTCDQCRGNSVRTEAPRRCRSTATESSVISIVSPRWRRCMLAYSAQPSSHISRPANATTGQKPRSAINPAMPKDTPQVPRKNDRAPDGVSEQFGAMAMRAACVDIVLRRSTGAASLAPAFSSGNSTA